MNAPARRLLFVSYHYLPRNTPGSIRVAAVARALARAGWDVTVLTSGNPSPGTDGVRVVSTDPQRVAGVVRGGPLARRLREAWTSVAIPDAHVGWSFALARSLTSMLDRESFDVVLTSSPPHSSQLAVAGVRRSRRFRWVADFRDPWTAPMRNPRFALSTALQRRMERHTLRAADAIIANTEGNRRLLEHDFPREAVEKTVVIPNGFEDSMLDAVLDPERESCDLTYVGEVYLGMLDTYLAGVARLRSEKPGLTPTLAVYGEIDPREWRKVEAQGLADRVERRGFVSYDESLRAMRCARALLLLLPGRESWRTCVPSKAYPYLATGRPVLALVPEGDAAALLRETRGGVAVTTAEPSAVATAVADFVASVRAGTSGSPAPEQVRRFAYSAIGTRVDAVLRRVVEGRRG
jgi:hypothetical protein